MKIGTLPYLDRRHRSCFDRVSTIGERRTVSEAIRSEYYRRGDTVHHRDPDCPAGRQIPHEWIVSGTGALPLCSTCRIRAEARPASGAYLGPSTARDRE
jgi:hypothetical protein